MNIVRTFQTAYENTLVRNLEVIYIETHTITTIIHSPRYTFLSPSNSVGRDDVAHGLRHDVDSIQTQMYPVTA